MVFCCNFLYKDTLEDIGNGICCELVHKKENEPNSTKSCMPTESANVASTAWVRERERKGVGGEDKKERVHVVSKTGKYWCVLYSRDMTHQMTYSTTVVVARTEARKPKAVVHRAGRAVKGQMGR